MLTIEKDAQYSLAIGFFDGLHKGHQAVIKQAKQKAKELRYSFSSYDI